ncbi:MAG: hypothetical protein H6707_18775 [Deltaproteobacteria bacterium]|nr:hypothetical protein [Deltaproteobacteria bacterium]
MSSKIDQFESVFLAASRTRFEFSPLKFERVLVITDLSPYETRLFADLAAALLPALSHCDWQSVGQLEGGRNVEQLLELVEHHRPDLICTYRHLDGAGWRWPYGLGDSLVVLTQATTTPVLMLPRPDPQASSSLPRSAQRLMAITSTLAGDHRLVSVAAQLTPEDGTLFLSHIEDDAVFERYIQAIAKIPAIDTNAARAEIGAQLLKDAQHYIASCADELARVGLGFKVEEVVAFGHRLREYRELVARHQIDLLVLNTKDDDQLAMHGLAYPLAVELNGLPLLML